MSNQPRHAAVAGAIRPVLDAPDRGAPDPGGPDFRTGSRRGRHAGQPTTSRGRRALLIAVAGVVALATTSAGTMAAIAKTVTITVDGTQQQITTLSGTVAGALESAGIAIAPHDSLAPGADAGIADGSAIVLDRGRRITLAIDGRPETLWTTGPTVADALAQNGITVGAHDVLAPAPTATVADGQRIVLDRGRPLVLTVDGAQHRVWTTATTVQGALARLGRQADEYQLSADRSRPIPLSGISVTATSLRTVTVTNGVGRPARVITAAGTVADLLAEQKITLGPRDTVTPAAATPVTDGLQITVTRRAVTTIAHSQEIPQPADRKVSDDALEQGSTTVASAGHPGVALVTSTVTMVNGIVTATGKSTRTVLTPAVARVVHVGTAPRLEWRGSQVYTNDHTYGVNWDGLAMCESTHNPRAINANPSAGLPTYGLFQFDLPTWQSVGGSGNPIDASPAEQLMRAKLLYQKRGLSPWACAYAAH